MGRMYNIQSGDIFGRLVVIGKAADFIDPKSKKHMTQYLCQCSCPERNTVIVKAKNLVGNITRSCGCLRRETTAAKFNNKPIENYPPCGYYVNEVIYAYHYMIYEATRAPETKHFNIPVYGKWINSKTGIKAFYDDMSPTYELGCKVGRINNSLGYRPDNCIWVEKSIKQFDRINDMVIKYEESSYMVSEWNRAMGYEKNTIRDRIIDGYSYEDAISGTYDDRDFDYVNAIFFMDKYGRPVNNEYAKYMIF